MMTVRTKVDVANRFPQMTADISKLARDATAEAARVGAQAAAQVAALRGIGPFLPSGAGGTPDGWEASFVSAHRASWYQSLGTLGNRRKALKQPRNSHRTRAPGTGIEPLNFLLAGRAAGRRALLEHIGRGLPR